MCDWFVFIREINLYFSRITGRTSFVLLCDEIKILLSDLKNKMFGYYEKDVFFCSM